MNTLPGTTTEDGFPKGKGGWKYPNTLTIRFIGLSMNLPKFLEASVNDFESRPSDRDQ